MFAMRDSPPLRTDWALLVGLVGWNILQNSVPRRWYGWLNGVGTAAALAVGRSTGLTWCELGLGSGAIRRGSQSGGSLAGLIVAAMGTTASTRNGLLLFRDERVVQNGAAELAREALFRIPVGTALFEEVVFRGLVFGRLNRTQNTTSAAIAASALFGLWHVIPTLKTAAVYRGGLLRQTPARTAGTLAGGVVGSAAVGMALNLLRTRSRSLLTPIVVHAAVNVMAYVMAWRAAPAHRSTSS